MEWSYGRLKFAFAFVFVSTIPSMVLHLCGLSLHLIINRLAHSLLIIDLDAPESMQDLMIFIFKFLFFYSARSLYSIE